MNNKMVGLMLVLMGIALMAWGYDKYGSVTSQASLAIGGGIPIEAWVGLIGGAINIFVGGMKIKND